MFEPGTIVNGRYKVLSLIGEGGMGSVYLAEHVDVGRKVAIKLLRSQFADDTRIVERFQREARAAAAIGHENIVEVFDFGRADGLPYMVMEHLRGESLRALLDRRGRLEPRRAADIMIQTLAALHAAHDAGIVHRDLKPDNVFLTSRASSKDFVKLLDFGISKFRPKQPLGDNWETQPGTVVGTVYYMAPEQLLARADADHRVDIHSAGVVLYEMLTGWLPFEEESQAEAIMQIVYRPREVQRPTKLVDTIPPELERVVMRALEPEPGERYPSAADFARALTPFASPTVAAALEDMLRKRASSAPPPSQRPAARRAIEETPTQASLPGVTPEPPRGTIPARPNARTPGTPDVTTPTPGSSETPGAAAQEITPTTDEPRSRKWLGAALGAVALATLVTVVSIGGARSRAQSSAHETSSTRGTSSDASAARTGASAVDPARDASVAPTANAMVSLSTLPAGARVRDAVNGTTLCGQTPCFVPVGPGSRRVVIVAGATELEVVLDPAVRSVTIPVPAATSTAGSATNGTTPAGAADASAATNNGATNSTSGGSTGGAHRRRRRDDSDPVEVPLFAPR